MKFPDMHQYITVLFSLLAEFLTTQNPSSRHGRPRHYADASLLVFYAAMALKGTRGRSYQTFATIASGKTSNADYVSANFSDN